MRAQFQEAEAYIYELQEQLKAIQSTTGLEDSTAISTLNITIEELTAQIK